MQWYRSVLIIHSLFHTFSGLAPAQICIKIRALRLCSDFHIYLLYRILTVCILHVILVDVTIDLCCLKICMT